jgi:hypothetical protein
MDHLDSNHLILGPVQTQQIEEFREALQLCKSDTEKYQLCVNTRDHLLEQYNGVELLITAFKHIMSSERDEYKQRKAGSRRTEETDTEQWKRFIGVATSGLSMISTCLPPLKSVSRSWGQDQIQYY